MEDKELLELAAKAAGIKIAFDETDKELTCMPFDINRGVYWNHLTDDGDALRLEVDLNLTTKHRFLEILGEENVKCCGDYRKARRLAIVRAAAEIVKDMK